MTSKTAQAIKNGEAEVMVVNKALAKDIRKLGEELNTSSLDVVSAALELLRQSLHKEVVIREPKTGKETRITALSNINE